MKSIAPAVVVLGLVAAVSGCADYDQSDPSSYSLTVGEQVVRCNLHEECAAGQRCQDGVCRDEPLPCGEEPSSACSWDLEDEACWQAGGVTKCSALDPDYCWCSCPASDSGCPCWNAAHCQGHCRGDEDNCVTLQVGNCSDRQDYLPLGCHCVADPDGSDSFLVVCAD